MSETLQTVLLCALPASGKSEVRRYLAELDPAVCTRDFHMGATVQIDDFPYVHMMRQIDAALRAQGKDAVFFQANDKPFADPRDWGTLIELVNEDYDDLQNHRLENPQSAGSWLLDRLDAARGKVGAPQPFAELTAQERSGLCDALEREARDLLSAKQHEYPDSLAGKTLVIEFARGGPENLGMPLPAPFGYAHSMGTLSPEILKTATVLYIWVTPEQSRQKNDARANPDDPGSILHHGVPIDVMLNDYGCDDIGYLIENAEKPDHITIKAHGKSFNLPIARLDNRVDLTSFVREDKDSWAEADVKALHDALAGALTTLHSLRA